jgi:hypothetical protein
VIAQSLTQIAYQALRDLGCLRPGQQTSSDVLNDIETAANSMIDAWLLEKYLVYADAANQYTLGAGIQQYPIGPTVPPAPYLEALFPNGYQFIQAPRPTRIDDCNVILNTVTPVIRLQVAILNRDQWAAIAVQQLPDAIPLNIYYDQNFDNTYGFGTLNIWPGPLTNYGLELYTWQQIQSFPNLTTPLSFPPGYARMIQKNLAVEIAPMMTLYNKLGRVSWEVQETMLARVEKQAAQAKEDVMSFNAPQLVIGCDSAFLSRRGAAFNFATGLLGRNG